MRCLQWTWQNQGLRVLNNLEVAKDVGAAQALNKVAGVIQVFMMLLWILIKDSRYSDRKALQIVTSCIFPILRGKNGKSSQKIVPL